MIDEEVENESKKKLKIPSVSTFSDANFQNRENTKRNNQDPKDNETNEQMEFFQKIALQHEKEPVISKTINTSSDSNSEDDESKDSKTDEDPDEIVVSIELKTSKKSIKIPIGTEERLDTEENDRYPEFKSNRRLSFASKRSGRKSLMVKSGRSLNNSNIFSQQNIIKVEENVKLNTNLQTERNKPQFTSTETRFFNTTSSMFKNTKFKSASPLKWRVQNSRYFDKVDETIRVVDDYFKKIIHGE